MSGPAAGVIGALSRARGIGRNDVITLDMGGTSADVALIQNQRTSVIFGRTVAGFPIRLPAVDVHAVGAGGGSIAWFDRDGLLKVGPQSAGSEPGPACYARGGIEPRVTDANLLLGRLSSRGLLDGRMPLDSPLSVKAFQPISKRLGGFSVERTAHGVLGIVVANMVRAIRSISVERGHDPRAFTLMPFGGAGPLHAHDVTVALNIREILVPSALGIVCAEGSVLAEQSENFVLGTRLLGNEENFEKLRELVHALSARARSWYEAQNIPEEKRGHELSVDTCYVGQNFELLVPLTQRGKPDPLYIGTFAELRQAFSLFMNKPMVTIIRTFLIELINVRLNALEHPPTRCPPSLVSENIKQTPQMVGSRKVWFIVERAIEAPVYTRQDLASGHRLNGQAIIEQLDTTTLLYPGDRLVVDDYLNLLIEVDA